MRFFSSVGLISFIIISAFLGIAGQNSQKIVEMSIRGIETRYPQGNAVVEACFEGIANWQDAKFLPHHVNSRLRVLMGQRCRIFPF